jgi:hypothetical protein
MNKTPQRTTLGFYFNDFSDLGISEDENFEVFLSNSSSIKCRTHLKFFEMIRTILSFFL